MLLEHKFQKVYLFRTEIAVSRFSVFGHYHSMPYHGITIIIGLILVIALIASSIIYSVPNADADDIWSVGSQLSSIKADGDNVYILWQNNSPDQNIYFKKSPDNGNSFGSTIRISNIGGYSDSAFGFASDGLMAVPIETKESSSTGNNAGSARYVYIAWLNRDLGASYSKVLFRSSSDGGNTFSEPISLTVSNFKGDSGIQQLFASGNNVYAVLINEWADENNVNDYYYDLVLRVSTDNGKTFGEPEHLIPSLPTRNVRAGLSVNISPLIDPNSNLGDGTGRNNQHDDAVYVTWIDYGSCTIEQVTCEDIKIFFRKSTDNGKTFSNPVEIKRPKEALDYDKTLRSPEPVYLQIDGSSDGKNVYVVWAEYILKQGNQRIFLAKSNDGGLTFSGPIDLSKSGISVFPRLIVPSYGKDKSLMINESTVYVAWKYEGNNSNNAASLANEIPRILLLKSSDGGNTFSQPINVSPKMTMPFLDAAAHNANHLYVAWENQTQNLSGLPEGHDVYFTASNDGGQTFGNILDLTDDNALKTILAAQNKALSFVAAQIATSSDGNHVYVAWQARYPDSNEIYVRTSADAGQSFGRIISLNQEAKDPISKLIAAGSSNPFLGQILTPIGLTVSSIGVAVLGIVVFMIFRRRKK